MEYYLFPHIILVTKHNFCYNVVKFQIENDTIYRVADNRDDLFKSVIIPTILLAPILYTLTIISVTTLIEIAV
jgi:hypothetical protein